MADNFNASLVISTSDAVANVRSLDSASKDLDKTLAHLHTTMQAGQADLDKVAKSLKVFNDTQRTALRDQKARDQALITASKLEREQIVTKGKATEATQKQAKAEQDLANAKAKGGQASATSIGNATRRNAESDARLANQSLITNARVGTELERRAGAEQRTAAAIAQRGAAEDRAAMSAMRLQAAQERANNSNLALNDSLSNSRYLLYDVAQTYAVLSAALLAVPVATTAVAASYEKDFAQVIRTNGLTEESSRSMFGEIQQLGKEIPLSFSKLSEIATIGGQLGIAEAEIGSFTETVAKFGAASNVATSDAATAFGRLENSFNANGKIPDFFNKVGSAIAKVGVESAASETEIIAVSNQISAAGAQFGFTADEVVGLSGALASVRIRPEMARGAFQRILLQLSRAADEGSASFDKFAKYTGVVGQAGVDLFKQDPSAFFNQYISGIRGTIDAGQSVSGVLDDIGAKNVFDKQFILGLANGIDVYNKALSDSSTAFKDGTFLTDSTKATFETFAATVQRLGNALAGLGARLGGGTLAPLTALADVALNVVSGFDRLIQQQPALGAVLNVLLLIGGVTGAFLAFKAAQAFVLAGLVGLQQVMGRASIAGALSLRGNIFELSKTMLMSKGASAEMAMGLLANKTAMQQLGAAATATRASLAAHATALTNTSNITRNAGAATGGLMTGLKSFGGAMLGLVGGPIGAVVLGLGVLITSFISTQEQAAQAGDAIARAMKNGADATMTAAINSLGDIKVTLADGVIAAGNLDKKLIEVARDAGLPFEKLAEAALKGKDAGEAVNKVLDEAIKKRGFADLKALNQSLNGDDMAFSAQLGFIRDRVTQVGEQSVIAGKNQEDMAKATDKVGGAARKAAPEAEGLKAAFEEVGSESDSAADKITKFIDAIFGLTNAGAATQEALNSLGEGLAKSTNMGTGTDGGRNNLKNFQEALKNAALEQKQLIDNTGKSTQQASADYIAFVDGLMSQLASKGVDVGQVQALADQAKGVFATTFKGGAQPKITPTVEAGPVLGEVQVTNEKIQGLINASKPSIVPMVNNTPAMQATYQLAMSLAEITGLPFTVIVDALTNPAAEKSAEIYALLTSITNGTYVAPIGADISVAVANVQSFSNYARQELATLQNQYNSILAMSQTGKGFFKGAANLSLGKNFDGSGNQTYFGPDPAASKAAKPAPVAATAAPAGPTGATPNFGALNDGYNKVADAANKAGDAGKKAGEDMANGIDDATAAAEDYANRLKTGLTSAFEKQYGMQKATDEYHSALNAIVKKRDDELKQLDDLIAKQKELNNSRDGDLNTARKAGSEKDISQKYGETNRAMDYAQQEQEALNAAAAKQKDIDANNQTIVSLQDGIDNFDGYSQAAIDNRAALRDLESKMLDMIVAYAATGASQEQVRAYAQRLTAQFRVDEDQVWRNRVQVQLLQGDFGRYIDVINRVPMVKATTVNANTGGAMGALQALNDRADWATRPRSMEVVLDTSEATRQMRNIEAQIRGGGTADNPSETAFRPGTFRNMGGIVPGFAAGGLIPGNAPADPHADNLFADVNGKGMIKVRSGEFIVKQPAVDYWGLDFFKTLNNMKMPAFNAGGSVGGGAGPVSGAGGPVLVELTADNIQAILRLADRPVDLYAGIEKLASTVNQGNKILASKGVS